MSAFIEDYSRVRKDLETTRIRLEGEIKEEEELQLKLEKELGSVPTSEEMEKILACIKEKKEEVEAAQKEVEALRQTLEAKQEELRKEKNLESILEGKENQRKPSSTHTSANVCPSPYIDLSLSSVFLVLVSLRSLSYTCTHAS